MLTLVRSQVAQNRINGKNMQILVFHKRRKIGEQLGNTQKNIRITARAPRATSHPAALCCFLVFLDCSDISYFSPNLSYFLLFYLLFLSYFIPSVLLFFSCYVCFPIFPTSLLFPINPEVLFMSYLSPISGNHGFSRLSTPEIDRILHVGGPKLLSRTILRGSRLQI